MGWNGFRVRLVLGDNEKMFFIFVNLSNLVTVGDLHNHVKTVFSIDRDFNLLVGSVSLPLNESVLVVHPNDTLRVELLKDQDTSLEKTSSHDRPTNTPNGPPEPSSQSSHPSNGEINGTRAHGEVCTFTLPKKSKRNIIDFSRSVGVTLNLLRDSNGSSGDTPTVNDQDDSISEAAVLGGSSDIVKARKRKRKRKSGKSESSAEKLSTEHFGLSDTSIPEAEKFVPIAKNKNQHVYFTNEEIEIDECELADKVKNEEPQNDSWKENLLSLAKKPLASKTFYKKVNQSVEKDAASEFVVGNVESDLTQYPIIDRVQEKDLISFKVLKIGPDYCPIVSNNLVGKVLAVDSTTDTVTFDILEGADELKGPEGKFEVERNESTITINDFKFTDLIEPRLLFP